MPAWLKRTLIRMTVLAVIAVLVFEARRYVLNVHPVDRSNVQRVTLLNPEPERKRVPEPEIQPPAPEPKVVAPTPETSQFFKFDDYAPGDAAAPPGPRDDLLGVDTEGRGGSDSFGLVGKRGGQDITTLGPATSSAAGGGGGGGGGHGQGGAMAKFAAYATGLKDLITSELNRHDNLRIANYDAVVAVWIEPDGHIRKVALMKSTGTPKIDKDIGTALASVQASSAPPSDMPQPVNLRIQSRGAVAATP